MYAKENNMADAGIKASAKLWNRQWTETELKYFALVLAGEKHEFSYKLDTLALKKTANKTVFENIEKASEERMSSGEFKRENEQQYRGSKLKKDLPRLRVDVERLRVWKMMKSEGWKISNVNTRIASRKAVVSLHLKGQTGTKSLIQFLLTLVVILKLLRKRVMFCPTKILAQRATKSRQIQVAVVIRKSLVRAWMSSRASAALFLPSVSTPWSTIWTVLYGSIWTSLHTIFSISASKSCSSWYVFE